MIWEYVNENGKGKRHILKKQKHLSIICHAKIAKFVPDCFDKRLPDLSHNFIICVAYLWVEHYETVTYLKEIRSACHNSRQVEAF